MIRLASYQNSLKRKYGKNVSKRDMNPQEWNPLNPQSIRKLTQESQDQVNGWRI